MAVTADTFTDLVVGDDKVLKVPKVLVAPTFYEPPPNALTERKFFPKVGQTTICAATPQAVHFSGFQIGKVHKQRLLLTNVSTDMQRWHIIPPNTSYFKIVYKKPDRLVPGFALEIIIDFLPDEWRYFYDCIRVHGKNNENLLVSIHAYPVMSTDGFPQNVNFPLTPVGETSLFKFPLQCTAPIDFEFQLSYIEPHPAFEASPLSGVVPAEGVIEIGVKYSPTEFSTAVFKLGLVISQFKAEPLVCTFVGTSLPGHHRFLVEQRLLKEKSLKAVSLEEEMPLDPEAIRSKSIVRRKKKESKATDDRNEVEYRGFRFPRNLNNPHAVGYVLNQEENKVKIKALRKAIDIAKAKGSGSRQMKEAIFETAVRDDVQEERLNKLRWQVQLGYDPISTEERLSILEDRKSKREDYKHTVKGVPFQSTELSRKTIQLQFRRTFRCVSDLTPKQAVFDIYKNDPYKHRFRYKRLMHIAFRYTVIRLRAQRRCRKLRKLITNYKSGLVDKVNEEFSSNKDFEFELKCEKVEKTSFPVYQSPDHKDDLAPDAIGAVPVLSTLVVIEKQTNFVSLVVPQQYKLMGYESYDVHTNRRGYVRPGLARPLKRGAEDELVAISKEASQTPHSESKSFESSNNSTMQPQTLVTNVGAFTPPCGLSSPVQYHPLQIFNELPGIQPYYRPLPYSEADVDFKLCPIPRYTPPDSLNNPHHLLQKKFIDEEDVIRGTMTWKRFPSQGFVSLANMPTLSQMYVPRYTDPFLNDMIPGDPHPLLQGIAKEDESLITKDLNLKAVEVVTPETVRNEWKLTATSVKKSKESIQSKTFASYNPTSMGQPSRAMRELELEDILNERHRNLGERISERITKYHNLVTLKELILE